MGVAVSGSFLTALAADPSGNLDMAAVTAQYLQRATAGTRVIFKAVAVPTREPVAARAALEARGNAGELMAGRAVGLVREPKRAELVSVWASACKTGCVSGVGGGGAITRIMAFPPRAMLYATQPPLPCTKCHDQKGHRECVVP